jgi:hypothetical protein
MRLTGYVARMGEKKTAHKLFIGKPEGNKPLERPKRRWMDKINMDL